jgi:hypothetical protein
MSNAQEVRRVTLTIELEYDVKIIHGCDEQAKTWFFNEILSGVKGDLALHSNDIGDFIGTVKVLAIIDKQPAATVNFYDLPDGTVMTEANMHSGYSGTEAQKIALRHEFHYPDPCALIPTRKQVLAIPFINLDIL